MNLSHVCHSVIVTKYHGWESNPHTSLARCGSLETATSAVPPPWPFLTL